MFLLIDIGPMWILAEFKILLLQYKVKTLSGRKLLHITVHKRCVTHIFRLRYYGTQKTQKIIQGLFCHADGASYKGKNVKK